MFNADPSLVARLSLHLERVLVIDPFPGSAKLQSDMMRRLGAYEVQTAWRQDVWYRDPEMGLRILRRHDLNAMVPAHLRVAKAIWLQERRSA